MKLVYEQDIIDKLGEVIRNARVRNKKIDYIMLTPDEYNELRSFAGAAGLIYTPLLEEIRANDHRVKTHTRDKDGQTRRFVSSNFFFDGYPVICVPEEFQ